MHLFIYKFFWQKHPNWIWQWNHVIHLNSASFITFRSSSINQWREHNQVPPRIWFIFDNFSFDIQHNAKQKIFRYFCYITCECVFIYNLMFGMYLISFDVLLRFTSHVMKCWVQISQWDVMNQIFHPSLGLQMGKNILKPFEPYPSYHQPCL